MSASLELIVQQLEAIRAQLNAATVALRAVTDLLTARLDPNDELRELILANEQEAGCRHENLKHIETAGGTTPTVMCLDCGQTQ